MLRKGLLPLALLMLPFAACAAPVSHAPSAAKYQLTWAPPPCGGNQGGIEYTCSTIHVAPGNTGHQYFNLDGRTDYEVFLPGTAEYPGNAEVGGITFYGGHNIILIGGEIDLTTPCTGDQQNCHGINISRSNSDSGIIHIEGVLIKNPDPTHSRYTGDGIDVNGAEGTDLQIENVRIEGIDGCDQDASGAHADVFQPYGGVHDIRIDHLTGTSTFQGMEVGEGANGSTIHSGIFKDVNMDALPNAHPACQNEDRYLWDLTGTGPGNENCLAYRTSLSDDYVQPLAGAIGHGGWVWPDRGDPNCPMVYGDNDEATWPSLAPTIQGGVFDGLPAGGDFVPPGIAGSKYVSLGYCQAYGSARKPIAGTC